MENGIQKQKKHQKEESSEKILAQDSRVSDPSLEDVVETSSPGLDFVVTLAPSSKNMTPLQKYKHYIARRIRHYHKKASQERGVHNILQCVIAIGAAIVSGTVAIPQVPKWIPASISIIVTIAASINNLFKFGEHSRIRLQTAEEMQQEYNWFNSNRGPYKGLSPDEAFERFQDRIDMLRRFEFRRASTGEPYKVEQYKQEE